MKLELNIADINISELYEKLHIFHLIPNLFEAINFEEMEEGVTERNKNITVINNDSFILYFPSDGNLMKFEIFC